MHIFKLISIGLYAILGIVSLIMAYKSLISKKILSFHEKAAGISWDSIDKPLQYVILALMRVSGLGFFITGLLLLIFPVINYFKQDNFIKFSIPIISLIYCFGLFLFNYFLHKKTKADTPWIGSIVAIFIIIIGIILSLL